MCEYKAASYRLGTVVSARDKSDVNAVSSVEQARLIGMSIVNNAADYVDQTVDCISGYGQSAETVAAQLQIGGIRKSDSAKVRSRFAPGLILDLPSVSFDSTLGHISVRSCITVCSNGARSKVWTRFVTKNNGADNLSEHDLTVFGMAAEVICAKVNEAVRVLYQRDFRKVAQVETNLEPFGHIHLFTVDCEGNGITNELRDIATDLLWADKKLAAVVQTEVVDALRDVTSASSISGKGHDQKPLTREFQLSESANFFTFEASTDAPSLLVHHTRGVNSYFVGLIGVGGAAAEDTPEQIGFGFPVGVGTTAEIAGFLGSAF